MAIAPVAVSVKLITRLLIRAAEQFSFSNLVALTAKSENKKAFSTSEKARITRLAGRHIVDM